MGEEQIEAYLDQGLLASQALHGRPVLSICIAWLHQATAIPLLYCGLLLNAAFYAVLVLAFVATVSARWQPDATPDWDLQASSASAV